MGKSIIEKLGITPLATYYYRVDGRFYNPAEVRTIEQQRNEMLEALINNNLALELIQNKNTPGKIYLANKVIIEKVTGRIWEEIKELL